MPRQARLDFPGTLQKKSEGAALDKGHEQTIRSQTFSYDHLDRLTEAQCAAYGTINGLTGRIKFEYDKIGNIVTSTQVSASFQFISL